MEKGTKMKELPRDLVFFVSSTKATAIGRTFFCYALLSCLALTLIYSSIFGDYRLQAGYGRAIETFAAFEFGPIQEAFWCNRSDSNSDVCYMSGNVHLTTGDVSSVILYSRLKQKMLPVTGSVNCSQLSDEVIRPYARKRENGTMESVKPIGLKCTDVREESIMKSRSAIGTIMGPSCRRNQTYSAPAVLFSSAGFSGNPYHDFHEVMIPLFITAQHLKGNVVFLISDVRPFWVERWRRVLQKLSRYPLVNIQEPSGDYCFREMTVGLYTHDKDFSLDPSLMPNNETIDDFRHLLREALETQALEGAAAPSTLTVVTPTTLRKGRVPKLLIIARKDTTRVLTNLDKLINLALEVGFDVQVGTIVTELDLQTIYEWFHSSDVVMAVHGCELSYMTFMRKNRVVIQIVPIGTNWPSTTYYGEPAWRELGLHYLEYKIKPNESSLADEYGLTNRIVVDPDFYIQQGFEFEYKYYLKQSVRPSPESLREILVSARTLVSDLPPE